MTDMQAATVDNLQCLLGDCHYVVAAIRSQEKIKLQREEQKEKFLERVIEAITQK